MKKTVTLLLAALMILGVAGAAFADTVVYPGADVAGKQTASGVVAVSATVNPKISLSITTPDAAQSVAYGPVDPGGTYGGKTVNLAVDSNKAFDLTSVQDTTAFGSLSLNRSLADVAANPKGSAIAFADTYSITVPADADPLAYSATVTYSVVQN